MSTAPIQYSGPAIAPEVPHEVAIHLQLLYQKAGNHTQAFGLIQQQIAKLKSGSTTTIIEGGGGGGSVPVTTGILAVDNETGQTSFTTQPGDNGSLLILSDASPIAVTLSGGSLPYGLFIANIGTGTATLTPALSATISYAGNSAAASMPLPGGYSCIVAYDGVNWWGWTEPIQPNFADNESVTITAGSGTLAHTPNPSASLQLFAWNTGFGATLLVQGQDYTLAGAVITLGASVPPTVGAYRAFYRF